MGKLIDAERKVHIQIYDDEHEEYRTHEMSIADVLDTYTDEGCPDAEPSEQQWIPCSERLPDEKGYYLTTTMYQEVYCDYWNGECFNRTEMIIAWKSLPEPWKGKDNE